MKTARLRGELTTFRDKLGVPAVVGAVTNENELVAIEVVGTRSRRGAQPATVDDPWHIGSCGKSITALLCARLVEAGLTTWETSVADLFSDISGVDPGWRSPTINDLLRCRAGVRPNPSMKDLRAAHQSTAPIVAQRTAAARKVLASAPKKPGSFVYSNLAYGLVGAAIDRITGTSFEEALFERVLEPLGITTAGFGPPPLVRGHHPRWRVGTLLAGRGKPAEPNQPKPADNPPLLTPAGRLHLSVPDWAAILRVFLGGGAPLVSVETLEHLLVDPGPHEGRSMSMGWASGAGLGASHAMQGSNTMWAATALMDRTTGHTALTVANDGRTSVLMGTAHLAGRLLAWAR